MISGTVAFGDAATDNGTYAVTVSATDGITTVSENFLWTIASTSLTLSNPGNQSNTEQDSVSVQLFASGGQSGNYTYSATNLPGGLSLDQTGLISGTVSYLTAGSYPATVTVFDGFTSTSETFTWAVASVPLSLQNPGDQSNAENQYVYVPLAVSGGESTSYVYSATGLPSGVSIDSSAGVLSGTLAFGTAGTYAIVVSASDGVTTVSQNFTWTVAPAPLLLVPGDQFNVQGQTVSVQIQTEDYASSGLIYSATGLPTGLSIDPNTGLISGTLPMTSGVISNSVYEVTVYVVSPTGQTDRQQFLWTVSPYVAHGTENDGVTGYNDYYSVSQGDTLTVNAAQGVLANDTDSRGLPLTARLIRGLQNGTLQLNSDGSFTVQEKSDFEGQDYFVYALDDGTGAEAEAEAIIDCNANAANQVAAPRGPTVVPGNSDYSFSVQFDPVALGTFTTKNFRWISSNPAAADAEVGGGLTFKNTPNGNQLTSQVNGFFGVVEFNNVPASITLWAVYTLNGQTYETAKLTVYEVAVKVSTYEFPEPANKVHSAYKANTSFKAGAPQDEPALAPDGNYDITTPDGTTHAIRNRPTKRIQSGGRIPEDYTQLPESPAIEARALVTLVGPTVGQQQNEGVNRIAVGFVQHVDFVSTSAHYPVNGGQTLTSDLQGLSDVLDTNQSPGTNNNNSAFDTIFPAGIYQTAKPGGFAAKVIYDFDEPAIPFPQKLFGVQLDSVKLKWSFTLDVAAVILPPSGKVMDLNRTDNPVFYYREATVSWTWNGTGEVDKQGEWQPAAESKRIIISGFGPNKQNWNTDIPEPVQENTLGPNALTLAASPRKFKLS